VTDVDGGEVVGDPSANSGVPQGHGPGLRHFPFPRRARLDWKRLPDGSWHSGREDRHAWEVFCAGCGDTDGPADVQDEGVRQLRGPYKTKHHAKAVATRHIENSYLQEQQYRHIRKPKWNIQWDELRGREIQDQRRLADTEFEGGTHGPFPLEP
jgi:hypothetical protein